MDGLGPAIQIIHIQPTSMYKKIGFTLSLGNAWARMVGLYPYIIFIYPGEWEGVKRGQPKNEPQNETGPLYRCRGHNMIYYIYP